ncbi:MAG TPA: HD domain-containing protein [Polyangiaceae bacterium]|nr:HD domain-containing protein [Polyangiaceae bacterium]
MQLTDRYRRALEFAFELHREQERSGSGVPYFAHLIGVSSLVLEAGADEDVAIAALLHDAAEDQGGTSTLERIEQDFGAKVADIVRACTDAVETPRPPWRERKIRYVEHLKLASPEAQLVAASDKLYNLRTIVADYRSIGEALWSRFSGGRAGVIWYYGALVEAFTISHGVVAELRRTLAQLETLLTPGSE